MRTRPKEKESVRAPRASASLIGFRLFLSRQGFPVWKDETDASLLAEPSFVDGRTNRHGQKFSHGRYKPTARTALNPTNHRPPNLLARPSGTHYTIIFQL